jgi:hypothetical protein
MIVKKRASPGHNYWFVPAHVDLLVEADDAADARRKAIRALKKVDWLDIGPKPVYVAEHHIYQPDSVPD